MNLVAFFAPMFTPPPGIFGIPAMAIILAVGVVLFAVGFAWMRRVTEIEPDVHSFRTNQPTPRDYRPAMIATGAGILAALAIGLTVTNNWGLL